MKSSKIQGFWTGFILIMVLLFGGAGYFFFTSLNAFNNSKGSFEKLKTSRQNLEKAPIYPNKKHVDEFSSRLDNYEKEVDNLHGLLKKFQKPLNQIPPTQFPQDLRRAVEEFNSYAQENKVSLPENFYLGMEQYSGDTPKPGSTGILSYQLESINHLVRVVIDNGADTIFALKRDRTAVEDGKPDPELTDRVVKYPVTFSFRTSNQGFQEFLNEISNDTNYFYIIRVVRVDSEIGRGAEHPKLGPPIVDAGNQWMSATGEPLDLAKDEQGNLIVPEGAVLRDAVPILGNTKIRVTAVVDLCRFPEVVDAPPAPPTPAGGAGKKTGTTRSK